MRKPLDKFKEENGNFKFIEVLKPFVPKEQHYEVLELGQHKFAYFLLEAKRGNRFAEVICIHHGTYKDYLGKAGLIKPENSSDPYKYILTEKGKECFEF